MLALEDLDCSIGSDFDFTDFVVGISDTVSVNEPAPLLLLGLGLLAMAYSRRHA